MQTLVLQGPVYFSLFWPPPFCWLHWCSSKHFYVWVLKLGPFDIIVPRLSQRASSSQSTKPKKSQRRLAVLKCGSDSTKSKIGRKAHAAYTISFKSPVHEDLNSLVWDCRPSPNDFHIVEGGARLCWIAREGHQVYNHITADSKYSNLCILTQRRNFKTLKNRRCTISLSNTQP